MTCALARQAIDARLRGPLTDDQRALLDVHLAACAECRAEAASAALLGVLRRQSAPRLGAAARKRMLEHVLSAPRVIEPRRAWRRVLPFAGVGAAAALTLVLWARHGQPVSARAPMVASAPGDIADTDGVRLCRDEPGSMSFAGSSVSYRAGTALTLFPSRARVTLDFGEVDLDARASSERQFHVATPHFQVVVKSARCVVSPDVVRAEGGRVVVLNLDGVLIATVEPGGSWSPLERATVAAPHCPPAPRGEGSALAAATPLAPHAEVAPAMPTPLLAEPETRGMRTMRPQAPPSAAECLRRASHALGDGDTALASSWTARVRETEATPRQRAQADLLGAETALVAGHADDALAAYRRASLVYDDLPEGESAAFALAQRLSESHRPEASDALARYLARYPSGRFVREVRQYLAAVPSIR